MNLQKIEIAGFKSFAKTTVLEFPYPVTAIVGPNGSGKSNIAEAIRWVLGEQSIKSLRGKKGEDLIWNGSPASSAGAHVVPRVGKASVTLHFNNQDKKIPLDFEEVAVARKIFRDGINEYCLNDSQVRLKDIVELMARIGLGEQKHNIIGQGEVDRIIMATTRERREMFEEALGLRIYHLKKAETERKLEATGRNMGQVEALLREIAPHLKYLRTQAQKAAARESVEQELRQYQKIYFVKEREEIKEQQIGIEKKADPLKTRQAELGREIGLLLDEISRHEKKFSSADLAEDEDEKNSLRLEAKSRDILREVGRLEGRLEVSRQMASRPKIKVVDSRYIKDEVSSVLAEIRSVLENEDRAETIKSQLWVLVEDIEGLLSEIERGIVEEKGSDEDADTVKEFEAAIKSLQTELLGVTEDLKKYESVRVASKEAYRGLQQKIRGFDTALRAKQDEERDVALQLERVKFDEEKIRARRALFEKLLTESGLSEKDLAGTETSFDSSSVEDLAKRIERLCGKIEEIGGIDVSVVKEYEDTQARHAFLSKELEDIKQALRSLQELLKELDSHIREGFRQGFLKINNEFHAYFRIIFGGGRASLQEVQVPTRVSAAGNGVESEVVDEESPEEKRPTEPGIDITVDLPGKRVRGLAMLSGGERALTSIALLFSLTAVNPPPFLILDETDAALDEANSRKYAAILRELAKKTQLILVTHNRETMKCADILYGVTMGDDGVSKLLSLKMEEAEVYTSR